MIVLVFFRFPIPTTIIDQIILILSDFSIYPNQRHLRRTFNIQYNRSSEVMDNCAHHYIQMDINIIVLTPELKKL